MKHNLNYLITAVCFAGMLFSCKDHTLDDFELPETDPVNISAGSSVSNLQKDNEKVTFNVGIGLSSPATKAFQIRLALNNDTVNTLIENKTLENTVLLPSGTFYFPNVSNVAYGADSAFFQVQVNMTVLERYYGKKVAMAISLEDPGKGNETNSAKRTSLIVLNTIDIVDQDDIHYLSITNGGGDTLDVRRGQNYRVTSAGVTIPLGITLAGVPGSAFVVKTLVNKDTIATLVNAGKLPAGTKALESGKFNLDTVVNLSGNRSQFTYELNIPWSVMDQNAGVPLAIAISLKESNRHVLHPTDKSVVVFVDPSVNLDNNSFITGNGTGLKAEYFRGQELDANGAVAAVVRVDERIDFGGWAPIAGVGDNWSSRWTGEFLAPVRGEYTFYQTRWDDGARLYIDGKTLVNDFTAEWDKPSRFGKIFLERGQRYKIEAHHRENVGGQQARLEYEVAGAIGRTTVPRSQLFPAP